MPSLHRESTDSLIVLLIVILNQACKTEEALAGRKATVVVVSPLPGGDANPGAFAGKREQPLLWEEMWAYFNSICRLVKW